MSDDLRFRCVLRLIEQTTHAMIIAQLSQSRIDGAALCHSLLATRMEGASRRTTEWPGSHARNRVMLLTLWRGLRNRAEQGLHVRVFRVVENGIDVALFDNAPQIHNGNFVGDFRYHAEVMGDEQHRHAVLCL